MNKSFTRPPQGFVLLPVILAITVVAAIAFLINRESATQLNMTAGEAQASKAQYVAEAGFQHALWTANNSSCTGYSLSNTAFSMYSYSATFSPTTNSPVSITAIGTLAEGTNRSLARANIKIYQTPTTTVILQPDATSGRDAYLTQNQSNKNYGVSNNLQIQKNPGNTDRHALLGFDLADIPVNAVIRSAILELYAVSVGAGSPKTIAAYPLTTSWVEGNLNGASGAGVTWNEADTGQSWSTAGGDYAAVMSEATINPVASTWYKIDVGKFVSDWHTGKSNNNGIIIRGNEDGANVDFASSDDVDATKHPKLTITYACECGVDCGGGDQYYLDEFNAIAYDGDDGDISWSNDWQEIGESDGPTGGILRVVSNTRCTSSYCMRIGHSDIEDQPTKALVREADVGSATTATLSYDYEIQNMDNKGSVLVRVSGDGGSNWTTLATYTISSGSGSESFDISPYIASNTQIRVEVTGKYAMYLFIDNVRIVVSSGGG